MASTIPTTFGYRRSPDQDARDPHRPVVIVGAGPVGLTLALDLARKGVASVLLDDADRIGEGSRAICFAKRTLEIFGRLGLADRMIEKGVTWSKGKVFRGTELLYDFDLLPEGGHAMPAFINLQQYYVERYLVEAVAAEPLVDLRWRNKVTGLEARSDGASLTIDTPEGSYNLNADWVVACDGSRSAIRGMMGLDFAGEVFDDRFLIADVKMKGDFPSERWFWFEPPFHDGQSALLHKQPDDIWRIDLQLGRDADPAHEKRPEVVTPRIRAMLGHDDFSLEWVSVYTFQCRRLARFVHDRVVFAGDSAHQVSPFGARGANSGVQDADNLGWKLAAVLNGDAAAALIDSYDLERGQAADENIMNSTRSTDFIAPSSPAERHLRDAALSLAAHAPFAKSMVNSGRLSQPTAYRASILSTLDRDTWANGPAPGAPLVDAPLLMQGKPTHLGACIDGKRFTLLSSGGGLARELPQNLATVTVGDGPLQPTDGSFAARYDASPGSAWLLRPDGHVAARFRQPTAGDIVAARDRALART